MLPNFIVNFFSLHQDLLWIMVIFIDLGATLLLYRLYGKIGLYAIIVLNIMLSNLQGPKLTIIFGMETSLGLVLYAGIYFATDLLSEKYSRAEANKAVMIGFTTSVLVVLMLSFSLLFTPSPQREIASDAHAALSTLFSFTPHFVFGSLLVYLVSQHLDVWIFHKIKEKTKGKYLWLRNNASTMLSQLVDTALYTLLVWWPLFVHTQPDLSSDMALEMAFQLGIAKYIFKVLIALLDTPFIYWARSWDTSKIER